MKNVFVSFVVATFFLAALAFTAMAQSMEVKEVSPSNPQQWLFYNDLTDMPDLTLAGLGTFVEGPATTPYGTGSAQISVSGTDRRNLATYQFAGTPLAKITTMKFSTYNPSAGNIGSANRSAYLNFNVDFNGSDTWQRRLVFLPSDNGTVIQNQWQEWDTIQNGNAMWRYSGATWPDTALPGSIPRTWSSILAAFTNVRIRVTDAHMGMRVGEPYVDGYTENIDSFKFGTTDGLGGEDLTIFDFEQYSDPTNQEQCKKGGYRLFNPLLGSYPNQGQCVSSTVPQ